MRRSLAIVAFFAIGVSACGNTSTTPAAQPISSPASSAPTGGTMEAATVLSPASTSVSAKESKSPTSPAREPTAEAPPAATAPGVTITTADTEYGRVLFDGSGQAIYLFEKETTAVPDCYDDCAVAWPPVLTAGPAVAADGAMTDLLATTSRTDGSTQVTYAGHPLYYYAHEGKNEVTCHDVTELGGVWLAVAPTGQPAA